jgi:hypothetical protein
VTLNDQRRSVPRIDFIGIARGQIDPQIFLDPWGTLGRREIGAHARILRMEW